MPWIYGLTFLYRVTGSMFFEIGPERGKERISRGCQRR